MVPVMRVPFVSMVPLFSCSVVSAMVEHADAPVGSADIHIYIYIYIYI